MDLQGASALVTGGMSGLGEATAALLADRGAQVVVADIQASAEGVAVREGVHARRVDVTNEDDVRGAVQAATALGPLRVVVNCAGVADHGRVLSKKRGTLPLSEFSKVVGINLIGTFNVVRLAAEVIAEQDVSGEDRGLIVNTASVAAFDGQIGQAAYSASKGGVAAMTLPLARDLADKAIRVMTIAPGIFATPMMEGLPEPAQESLAQQIPHPSRLGKPAEYAGLVGHIVDNGALNGEVIRLDGAIRMAPK